MENRKFEIGVTYKGVSGVGECAVTVVRRSEKSIWVTSVMNGDKPKRHAIKVWKNHLGQTIEGASHYSWYFDANSVYSIEQQKHDAYYNAYCR